MQIILICMPRTVTVSRRYQGQNGGSARAIAGGADHAALRGASASGLRGWRLQEPREDTAGWPGNPADDRVGVYVSRRLPTRVARVRGARRNEKAGARLTKLNSGNG